MGATQKRQSTIFLFFPFLLTFIAGYSLFHSRLLSPISVLFSTDSKKICPNQRMLYRMATVIARRRKDSTSGYLTRITIKRNGEIAHRQA
ncbi:MAG: hypothetical protein WAM62_04100 [Pseudolabrys sp.]